ncbi:MAG TPA: lytic transglycosylase domain-containing protein [Naasia sp.]|jgi:hypothetical protein
MGKHSSTVVAAQTRRGVPSRPVEQPLPRTVHKAPLHGRIALSLFGFLAAFAFLLVNVTDPYAGATASPYYQPAGAAPVGEAQILAASTAELGDIARDNFSVTEKPKPPPPPPVVAAEASTSGGGGGWAPPAAVPDPGTAQAVAADMVAARGWGSDQYNCLVSLWKRESGWRVNAYNASSGAYGIPQALPGNKMASAGADWETNPATQIAWGLGYISARYGSPCGAWASSESRGWY